MSGAVISSNVSLKVNRAISGATTVTANSWAEVTYEYSTGLGVSGSNFILLPVTRRFGPGQAIPASITVILANGASPISLTYSLVSGVEFVNSP